MTNRLSKAKEVLGIIYARLRAPEISIPVAATLLSSVAALLLVKDAFVFINSDAIFYWNMAQTPIWSTTIWSDLEVYVALPVKYRILIPFIVRNLFNSSLSGFIFISIVSLLLSNYLVFRISQLYTRNVLASLMLVIIFSTNFTIFGMLVNPTFVDLPVFVTMLLLALIFLKYVVAEKFVSKTIWLSYSATLLVGVLIKEQIIFVLPVLFIYLLYTRKSQKAVLLLSYSLPAIAAHLVLRYIMGPIFHEGQGIDLSLFFRYFGIVSEYNYTTFGAYRSLFSTFGAIWLILPLALVHSLRNNRAMKETYVTIILSFVMAILIMAVASDHARYIFFISFPFLIPALALYFDKYNSHIKKGALYAFIILVLLTRLAMHYRPEVQIGFSPTAGQSEAVLIFISIAAVVQILVVLYYVIITGSLKILRARSIELPAHT